MKPLPAPLIRGLTHWWARRRTRPKAQEPTEETLRGLLSRAGGTRFGRQYGFAQMARAHDCYARFRETVPLMDYDLWVDWLGNKSPLKQGDSVPLVDEAWPGTIDMFCLSSGTTSGRTKFVPYSREMAAVNRAAALDLFAHLIRDRPETAPFLSQTLYMSGSTRIQRGPNGTINGDMSGLTKFLAPKFLENITLPPRSISAMEPWERRLQALVQLCVAPNRIGAISGIPIWQLTLLEAVAQAAQVPLHQCLPGLRFLIHGGMSMNPYREKLSRLVGPDVRFIEVYAASEIGIGAFQIPSEEGMRFCPHYQVFYEFEGPSGEIFPLEGIAAGVAYRLLVSSCSGLWRYRLGDVLVFRSTDPFILDYVTRDQTTSAFDEKVTEKELEAAMAATPLGVRDFSMGPDVEARRHMWFIIDDRRRQRGWLRLLDGELRRLNQDYDDYRQDGRIGLPSMVQVPDRGQFLNDLGRSEGGQRKFPRLLTHEEVALLKKKYGSGGQ